MYPGPDDSWIVERLKVLDAPIGYEERLERARQIAHACRYRVEVHHPYTKEHSIRVARWSRVIGSRLPTFSRERLDRLEITALVHDFGKIYIDAAILNKPTRLEPHEYDEVKKHPVLGAMRLEAFRDFVAMEGVLYHHLRFDGGGYPDGEHQRGAAICLEARIIAVADTFDALTSDRSYRKGRSPEEALRVMRREAGHQLDPTLVRIFEDYYRAEARRKGYSPGAMTIELSATLDEEVRRALDYLQHQIGPFDMRRPLATVEDKEALCHKAVDHLVSLTCERDTAEQFVRAAYRLEQDETFDADDVLAVEECARPVEDAPAGHQELALRLRAMRPRYSELRIAVFQGKLWKCVADGARMVLLR